MNESEDTEEIKHSPSTHTCCKDSRPCPTVSQYQLDTLVTQDTRNLFSEKNKKISICRLLNQITFSGKADLSTVHSFPKTV